MKGPTLFRPSWDGGIPEIQELGSSGIADTLHTGREFSDAIGKIEGARTNRPLTEDHSEGEIRKQWITRGWTHSLDLYLSSLNGEAPSLLADPAQPSVANGDSHGIASEIRLVGPSKHRRVTGTLCERRTYRKFKSKAVTDEQLSDLLYYGIRDWVLRACPASLNDADSPFFVRLALLRPTSQMKEGIFSYSLDSHSVTTLRHGNFADEVVKVMQGMQTARTASLTIFLCANFPKAMKIFPHSSGLRDLYVDAGRIIQGLILAAGAAGLGCLPTPALSDKPSEDLLDLRTPREAAVYSCTVGVLKS